MAAGQWRIPVFISLLSVSEHYSISVEARSMVNSDERDCLSLCLSTRISQEWQVQTSPNSPTVLPMAAAWSCGVIIRYVLPVLWMTSHGSMALPHHHRTGVSCTRPAVWYWLHPVIVQGCHSRVCDVYCRLVGICLVVSVPVWKMCWPKKEMYEICNNSKV